MTSARPTPTTRRADLGLLVLLAVIWGAAFPVIRLGLLSGASPFSFGAARFALAAALAAAIAALRREPWQARREVLISTFVGGTFNVAVYTALLNSGEEIVSGGLASVLIATVPLWTAAFATAVLPEERIGPASAVGLAAGFVGVLVLFLPSLLSGTSGEGFGEALVLGAAVSAATGVVGVRRFLRVRVDVRGLGLQFAFAAVVLAALSVAPGSTDALPLNAGVLASLAYLAAGSSVLGYGIFYTLIHRVGAQQTTVVNYLTPLAGIAVGIALLGEGVTLSEGAGFALILAGLLVYQWGKIRRMRATPSAPDGRAG